MKSGLLSLALFVSTALAPSSLPAQVVVRTNDPVSNSRAKAEPTSHVITKNDEKYIKAGAQRVVKRFMDLLNFVSTGLDIDAQEIESVIRQSYSQSENKIFSDSTSTIEDDLSFTELEGKSKQKTVSRYLNDFDLVYKKSNDASVIFSNFQVSNVKSGKYLYIKVFYDCLFKGKSTVSDRLYSQQKRVAELKVEKFDNKWRTWIIDIHFTDSDDVKSFSKNDIMVSDDATPDSNAGNDHPDDDLYGRYMKEALFAETSRNYEEALRNYRLAMSTNPNEADKLNLKIERLVTKKTILGQLDQKYLAGQYKDAIDEYHRSIKKDPLCSEYYFGRGKCYERIGNYKQSANDYSKAIELDAYNGEIYKARATLYEIQGDYQNAIADYTVFANSDKTNVYIFHKIAFLHVALDNLSAAIKAMDKAISINNNISTFYHFRGELFYKLKRTAEAQGDFTTAIKLDSTNAVSFFYKGLCAIDLKNPAEAAEYFFQAGKLNIDGSNLKRIREFGAGFYKDACSYFDAGNINAAILFLGYCIKMDPFNVDYILKRGDCFLKIKEFGKAINDFTYLIKISPANYIAYTRRGIANYELSNYGEAITDFQAANHINATGDTHKFIADAYFKIKDYKSAILNYETVLSLNKSAKTAAENSYLAEVYGKIGNAYFYSTNPFRAIQSFNESIRYNANEGETYFDRGRTYLEFNELGKAEEDFRKALSLNNKNARWNFKLGELYQRMAKYDLAIASYNTSMAVAINRELGYEPLYNRAVCLVNMNRYAEALTNYHAIKTNQADAKFRNFNAELGGIFLKLGKPDSALAYLDKALVKDPVNVSAAYQKAMAYLQKNKPSDALDWLEKALSVSSGRLQKPSLDVDFAALKNETRYRSLIKIYY